MSIKQFTLKCFSVNRTCLEMEIVSRYIYKYSNINGKLFNYIYKFLTQITFIVLVYLISPTCLFLQQIFITS